MTQDSNPEGRRARADVVARAIEAAIAPLQLEGMLGDWIVIGSTVMVDPEGDPDARYFMLFSGGSMLQHHAQGLVSKAQDMMADGDCDHED